MSHIITVEFTVEGPDWETAAAEVERVAKAGGLSFEIQEWTDYDEPPCKNCGEELFYSHYSERWVHYDTDDDECADGLHEADPASRKGAS